MSGQGLYSGVRVSSVRPRPADAVASDPVRQILNVGCRAECMAQARDFLESLGFAVVTATTLPGAVAACAARHFDLIIVSPSVPSPLKQALLDHFKNESGAAAVCLREENDPLLFSTLRKLQAKSMS